jgi:hypothetical protein
VSLKYARLVAVCLVVPSFTPTTHAQSLGELAKKTQEQREKVKTDEQAKKGDGQDVKVKKVYTDKDLAAVPPPPPTTPGEAPEAAVKETATGAATEKAAEPVKDEAYWRGRMATLRGNLARDKAACEPISAKVRDLDALYADSIFYVDGKAMVNRASAAVIETKQVDAKAELQQCAAKVASDEAAISTAEEEARRLSVLPGWLR